MFQESDPLMSLLCYVILFTYFQNHQEYLTFIFEVNNFPIGLYGKADNLMSLLSFKTTFDTFSFYPSRGLSHDPALAK